MTSKKSIPNDRPKCKTVGGLSLPRYGFQENKCLSGLGYKACPDDIFVITYPKSGTTWTQYIVWEIINFGALPPTMNDMLTKCAPLLEFTGAEPVEKLISPRVIKTHIPYHLIPYHHLAKYIYVARNPKDICVSYYRHYKQLPPMCKYKGSLDEFFEYFLAGDVAFGNWYEHVFPWYEHKYDSNVLFLKYEDMKGDPNGNILKIARFLGETYEHRLLRDSDMLARIVQYTSFENMKKMTLYIPKEISDVTSDSDLIIPEGEKDSQKYYKASFFWRGKVGYWKEFLNEEKVKRINDMIRNKPLGNEIAALWEE